MRTSLVPVAVLMTLLGACDSDGGVAGPSESASVSTVAVSTSSLATASSVPATGGDSTVCPPMTSTAPVEDGYPMRMSSLVGADIRTGAHACFERVVLELAGVGEMPGHWVAYEDDPVALSPSDQVVSIAGEATLVVRAAAWMTSMDGEGYQGPTEIIPVNTRHVVELRMIENFEGMCAWAIGLDDRRPFTVTTLVAPARIVIDIATG